MRCRLPGWAGLAVAGTVMLGACSSGPAGPVATTGGPSAALAPARSARPYQLLTHCGIDEARIGSRYFEAVHPLSDGHGNPPAGWGNPFQQGTMTLLSPTSALFRDHAGHHVRFRLRPGATTFKHLCE